MGLECDPISEIFFPSIRNFPPASGGAELVLPESWALPVIIGRQAAGSSGTPGAAVHPIAAVRTINAMISSAVACVPNLCAIGRQVKGCWGGLWPFPCYYASKLPKAFWVHV